MRKGLRKHVAQIILPSVVFSAIVGALTGAVVFAFRLISEEVILLSARIFGFADTHLWAVPLVVLGAVAVAFLVSMCLVYSPHSRGGGIPTAVALMRGLITFHWLRFRMAAPCHISYILPLFGQAVKRFWQKKTVFFLAQNITSRQIIPAHILSTEAV